MAEDLLGVLLDRASDAILVFAPVVDADDAISDLVCRRASRHASAVAGRPGHELVGESLRSIWPDATPPGDVLGPALATLRDGVPRRLDLSFAERESDLPATAAGIQLIRTTHDMDVIVAIVHDATGIDASDEVVRLRQRIEALEQQATRDILTGLSNRTTADHELNAALRRLDRFPSVLAVFYLDLDGFKAVNDTHGHLVGDEVLRTIATRLREASRPHDTVARLGGDEFLVVCEALASAEDALHIAERLAHACSTPIDVDSVRLELAGSVGIACTSDPATSALELIDDADRAMYRAKRDGIGIDFADPSLHRRAVMRRRRVDRLVRHGADAVELWWSPIARASDLRFVGAHVQVRVPDADDDTDTWSEVDPESGADDDIGSSHDGRGAPGSGTALADAAVVPSEGLPPSLIRQIGLHAIDEAARCAAAWRASAPDLPLAILVDVPNELLTPDFANELFSVVRRRGLPIDVLQPVIDQRRLTRGEVKAVVDELAAAGVRLVRGGIDLADPPAHSLRRHPFTGVRFDQKLVALLDDDGVELVAAAHSVARDRGVEVVSTGVDSDSRLETLRLLGSTYLSGSAISTPVRADEFVRLWLHSFHDG